MSSTVHQSAIHWLTARPPADPAERLRVDALVRQHEAACVAEEGHDPTCPPCQYQHRCQRGGGCPIREQEARHA
jgi:hypothetical protein